MFRGLYSKHPFLRVSYEQCATIKNRCVASLLARHIYFLSWNVAVQDVRWTSVLHRPERRLTTTDAGNTEIFDFVVFLHAELMKRSGIEVGMDYDNIQERRKK